MSQNREKDFEKEFEILRQTYAIVCLLCCLSQLPTGAARQSQGSSFEAVAASMSG